MMYEIGLYIIIHRLNQNDLVHVTLLHLFSKEMSDLHLFS